MDSNKPKPKPAASAKQPSKPAGKPPKKSASTTEYVFGWLGRQVGHVKKAVQADVTKKGGKPAAGKAATGKAATGPKKSAASRSAAAAKPSPAPADAHALSEKVIFRQDKVEEAELPHQPGVILRRTIIDEVVVERDVKEGE